LKTQKRSNVRYIQFWQLHIATLFNQQFHTHTGDDRLLSPLFIVLKELIGTFGPRVEETMFRENNIYILAFKSDKLILRHFEI